MAYQIPSDKILVGVQRGDEEVASTKPNRIKLFDGFVGNLIDPIDKGWTGPICISDFNTGEVLWIELPRKYKPQVQKMMAPIGEQSAKDHRRSSAMVNWNSLIPHIAYQCPDFSSRIHEPKCRIAPLRLDHIPDNVFSDTKGLNPNRQRIPDVGAITSGTYTVGPGGGDNYPTYSGAGGFVAAIGTNQTGNLTGRLNGNVTEAATASSTHNMAGFVYTIDSASKPNGDPTAGYVITSTINAQTLDFQQENNSGSGTCVVDGIYISGGAGTAQQLIVFRTIGTVWTAYVRNCMLNGNLTCNVGMNMNDDSVVYNVYNNVIWDVKGSSTSPGIITNAVATTSLIENNSITNCGRGLDLILKNCTCRNNCSLSNTTDYSRTSAATGRYNRDADGTATNANWSIGVGNGTTTALLAWQSTTDTQSTFLDLISGGSIDGVGETNGIARTTCIRGRPVPGNIGTSIGAAESPIVGVSRISPLLNPRHIGNSGLNTGRLG